MPSKIRGQVEIKQGDNETDRGKKLNEADKKKLRLRVGLQVTCFFSAGEVPALFSTKTFFSGKTYNCFQCIQKWPFIYLLECGDKIKKKNLLPASCWILQELSNFITSNETFVLVFLSVIKTKQKLHQKDIASCHLCCNLNIQSWTVFY